MGIADDKLRELQGALSELQLINRVVEKVSRLRETNHIMSVVLDELIAHTGSGQGVTSLISSEKDSSLVTVVRKGHRGDDGIPYKVSSQVSGWVIQNSRILKIDDLDSDARFPGLTSMNGLFKSLLCCPMVVRGEIIGLTTLVRDARAGQFDDTQARLAGIIVSQSGQILSNALLAEDLARKNDILDVAQNQLRRENVRLQTQLGKTYAFENIVGHSAAMRVLLTQASQAAATDVPVLIIGDTGTGKELIARAIHQSSRRHDKPLVVKNCGIKTETLLESELFGYTKGSFTGADRDKPGLFREADGGTVFLDEIGEAPLSTQVAILRVIESGEIRPVGSSRVEYVDVRVVSATNRDLKREIEGGNFRADLYYRLNTFALNVPPLSGRRDDIPLLTHHFMQKLKTRLGLDCLTISPEALSVLGRYDWPGNVRQLEHVIERAAIVTGVDGRIGVGDLPPEVCARTESTHQRSDGGPLKAAVEHLERTRIIEALEKHKGNIMRTAEELCLTRKGLRDKMQRYEIPGKKP